MSLERQSACEMLPGDMVMGRSCSSLGMHRHLGDIYKDHGVRELERPGLADRAGSP